MDRDKVIKGIRKCLSHKPCSENGCPYENECAVEHLNDPLLRDALALLKEQGEEIEKLKEIIKKADYTLEIAKDKINDLLKKTEGR